MMLPPAPAAINPPPSGYKRTVTVSQKPAAHAAVVLSSHLREYGYEERRAFDGVCYVFRVEPHYDAHVGGVLKWHPGVSVFTPVDGKGAGCEKAPPKPETPSLVPLAALAVVGVGFAAYLLARSQR